MTGTIDDAVAVVLDSDYPPDTVACFALSSVLIAPNASVHPANVNREVWRIIGAHVLKGGLVIVVDNRQTQQDDSLVKSVAKSVGAQQVSRPDEVVDFLTGRPQSWAYGASTPDAAWLVAATHATVINPDPLLRQTAVDQDWSVIELPSDKRSLAPNRVARTAAGVAAWFVGAGLGAATAIGRRDRQPAVNRMLQWTSDWSAAAFGMQVRVIGAEHAESPRPAVFLFNHQSELDTVIMAKVLRHHLVPVAKKELRAAPIVGAILAFAGAAFIDRADPKKAIAALQPAVDKLRAGISIGIAPEGTRSLTPMVAPFKKGAFHLARQARVPVIPVVIRNAGELVPKGAKTIHPGIIDVALLPPIDVGSWRDDELEDHIEAVRMKYLHTLVQWPG